MKKNCSRFYPSSVFFFFFFFRITALKVLLWIRSYVRQKERKKKNIKQSSDSTFKERRGGPEEIPLVQGKEQRLHFAGAVVKRYPTSKVRETQVRW